MCLGVLCDILTMNFYFCSMCSFLFWRVSLLESTVSAAALSASQNCVMWHPAPAANNYNIYLHPFRGEKWEGTNSDLNTPEPVTIPTINYPTKLYSFSKLLILKLLTVEYQNTYSLYGIVQSLCLRLNIETFQPKVDKIETDDLVSNSFKIQFCNFWKEFCFKLNGFRR